MQPLREPLSLAAVNDTILRPMFRDVLPCKFESDRAVAMLLTIGRQESLFQHRVQVRGPARGFWQFEKGTPASRGGVTGVFLHHATAGYARAAAVVRGVSPTPTAVYDALAGDAVLAAAIARLLLWTDPYPLPALGDGDAAWLLYLRTWRPGAHTRGTAAQKAALRQKWLGFYDEVMGEMQ